MKRRLRLEVQRAASSGAPSTSWPDDPAFRERLHNEFPSQVEAIADPVERRTFLKLMGASLALAGLTACTRQPAEKIVPYVRQPEEHRPGQAAVLRDGDDARRRRRPACSSRATKAGRPRSKATRASRQPRRDRRLRAGGDPRPLRSRSLADADQPRRDPAVAGVPRRDARGARRAAAAAGRRPAHPHRNGQLADARRADSRAAARASRRRKWHQWEPASRDNARAGAQLAFGEYVDAQYRFDQADVILSLDADFLGVRARQRCATRATSRRAAGPSSAERMNRLYAVESMPTVDRRARRSPPAAASRARSRPSRAQSPPRVGVAGVGRGGRRAGEPIARPRGSRRSPRICRRTAGAASSSPATSSRRPCTRSRTR